MEQAFFLLFASAAVAAALVVVLARNPVHSAVALMACFVQIAALFLLLRSPFLAVVQIFIYVGAIMVLFLFVMMMLDIRRATMERFVPGNKYLGFSVLAILSALTLGMIVSSESISNMPPPPEQLLEATTTEFGMTLFTRYLLPFEVASVVLLVALVGAIVIAKKESG
jgi:NADH-quinone oxidoreductase subunit J